MTDLCRERPGTNGLVAGGSDKVVRERMYSQTPQLTLVMTLHQYLEGGGGGGVKDGFQ